MSMTNPAHALRGALTEILSAPRSGMTFEGMEGRETSIHLPFDVYQRAQTALASAGQECVWRQDWELSYPACTAENPESGWPNKYADCMDFCPHCGRAIQKSAKETPQAKEGGAE